jgi:FAD/FMN-containing dehydrogenase
MNSLPDRAQPPDRRCHGPGRDALAAGVAFVAAGNPRLAAVLHRLDARIAAAGGRIYLAKDARCGREVFAAMYGRPPEWRAVREKLDPAGVFRSDLGRRLGLC